MLEGLASAFLLASVLLAARNSVHTWWLGIASCSLFIYVFFAKSLYADTTLMVFFIVINIFGWRHWRQGNTLAPIRTSSKQRLLLYSLCALCCAFVYGFLLQKYSDAYAPYWDSLILFFSVFAQILLMQRRLETWWFWLVVDTLAVPLFARRDLPLTALLYACLWCNVWFGLWQWRRQMQQQKT